MGLLTDRVALVTGGGRGIGRAIAIAYAQEGARVAVTARTPGEVDEVCKLIRSMGGRALDLLADLTDRDSIPRLLESVQMQWGDIDILVNNAGIGSSANPKPVSEFDDQFWDLTIELNLTVPYLLSKAVLPAMLRRQSGRIINIASINGRIASVHGAAYTASKHGLLGLTRTLATEVIKEGITVNAICPGPVHTAMNDKRIEYDAKRKGMSFTDTANSLTPMGRRLEPEEIAPLAVYLASDAASCITGQAINIDCGVLMF